MRDDLLRLKDMAEAIRKIEKYLSGGRQIFENDELELVVTSSRSIFERVDRQHRREDD
jgi:uncharacterized protein with HEPN domain